MASISEIKLNGNLYDIKDAYARNGDFCSICAIWDGNTEGLDAIDINDNNHLYRIGDSIEMTNDQYLIGNSISIMSLLLSNSSDNEIMVLSLLPSMLGINFGPGNFIGSSLNLQENTAFGQFCIQIFGDQVTEEFQSELRNLCESNIQIGVNLNVNKMMYINAPQECTLDLVAKFLFGIDGTITIPAGLWLMKTNNDIFFIDSVYLASPKLSKVMDYGVSVMADMLMNGTLPLSTLSLTKTE